MKTSDGFVMSPVNLSSKHLSLLRILIKVYHCVLRRCLNLAASTTVHPEGPEREEGKAQGNHKNTMLQKRIRPKFSITSGGRGTLLAVVTCFTLDRPDTKPFALGQSMSFKPLTVAIPAKQIYCLHSFTYPFQAEDDGTENKNSQLV